MAENYVTLDIDAPVPTFEPGDNVHGRFNVLLFESPSGVGPTVTLYFLMEAYDAVALAWKTWVSTGAPDPTASQYPGPPFAPTFASCLRAWSI